jgi:tryptophan-rich sensory protein
MHKLRAAVFNKMSWIYGLLPAGSLLFSLPYRCVPEPKTWVPPKNVRAAVWTLLAVTTGLAGAELYKLDDQESATIFIGLTFLFGTGWILTTRVCNQWLNVAYIVSLLLTAWWLFTRLDTFKPQAQAARARAFLIPLLLWLVFSTYLSGVALGAKVFKPKHTWKSLTEI